MNHLFQKELLKFLYQSKEAGKYIPHLKPDIFTDPVDTLTFEVLLGFHRKYKSNPSQAGALEYFERLAASLKNPLKESEAQAISQSIQQAYEPLTGSQQQVIDVLVEEYQFKVFRDLLVESAPKLKDKDPQVLSNLFRKVQQIKEIGSADFDEAGSNRGSFLLADYQEGKGFELPDAAPTYIKALNKMTTVRGFYAPQLIVLMAGPKGFKTGTLLNIALGYVRDGYKVYWADCENGEKSMQRRAKQCMLECTFEDLVSGSQDQILKQVITKFKAMGGDLKIDFYPPKRKTMTDVEAELDYLKETYNWVPDLIVYDYLDLFKPVDDSVKDKRLQIQEVYFDAIALQKRRNIFGFTLSQVKREAVDKMVIEMSDFAEDFGKAANAHGAFAICRDKVEKAAGIGRIVPVMQRDGVDQASNAAAFIRVDAARQTVTEITREEWEKAYEKQAKQMSGFEDKQQSPGQRRGAKNARPLPRNLDDL